MRERKREREREREGEKSNKCLIYRDTSLKASGQLSQFSYYGSTTKQVRLIDR